MKILRDWIEIGEAVNSLKQAELPLHPEPAKCWDLENVRGFLEQYAPDRASRVIDLGCGPSAYGCATLELMCSMGYKDLVGIDLHVPMYARLATAIRGIVKYGSVAPYRLRKGNFTRTRYPSSTFDAAVAVSVVEHGVDLVAFFGEVSRLLKPGGVLYVSTDYWHSRIRNAAATAGSGARGAQPLGWKIFDPAGIDELLEIARTVDLKVQESEGSPGVTAERGPIYWNGVFYTFLSLSFRKHR